MAEKAQRSSGRLGEDGKNGWKTVPAKVSRNQQPKDIAKRTQRKGPAQDQDHRQSQNTGTPAPALASQNSSQFRKIQPLKHRSRSGQRKSSRFGRDMDGGRAKGHGKMQERAGGWKRVRPPRTKLTLDRYQLQPDLISNPDDDAQRAWRDHEPPAGTIRLPGVVVFQADRHRRQHEAIARARGTYIFCNQTEAELGYFEFGIWGQSANVDATKRDLLQWLDIVLPTAPKTKQSSNWAKLQNMDTANLDEQQRRWKTEVKRQKFRQSPLLGMSFGAIGSFYWPLDEFKPDEILGMSYETLDAIRMDCSCYIVFSHERSVFQVSGKGRNVQQGLLRLRYTFFQVAVKQLEPDIRCLIHFDETSRDITHIYLKDYQPPSCVSNKENTDRYVLQSPRGMGANESAGPLKVQKSREDADSAREIILQTLEKLHFYRGIIEMRMRLGIFIVEKYQPPDGMYEIEEYQTMLDEPQFERSVTNEIGVELSEKNLLSVIQQSQGLLVPHEATIDVLTNVKPTYSATFVFEDGSASDLRLTMQWREAFDGQLTQAGTKWSRVETGCQQASTFIDISLQDLESGLAWQFDVKGSNTINEARLDPELREFAGKVRIRSQSATVLNTAANMSFLSVPKMYGKHKLHSVQQSIVYRYNITGSDYTLEVTRFQEQVCTQRAHAPKLGLYEPRWAVQVYRTEWDTIFTINQRLAVGARADWNDDGDTWFPPDLESDGTGDADDNALSMEDGELGFEHLLRKLTEIRKLVHAARLHS